MKVMNDITDPVLQNMVSVGLENPIQTLLFFTGASIIFYGILRASFFNGENGEPERVFPYIFLGLAIGCYPAMLVLDGVLGQEIIGHWGKIGMISWLLIGSFTPIMIEKYKTLKKGKL